MRYKKVLVTGETLVIEQWECTTTKQHMVRVVLYPPKAKWIDLLGRKPEVKQLHQYGTFAAAAVRFADCITAELRRSGLPQMAWTMMLEADCSELRSTMVH